VKTVDIIYRYNAQDISSRPLPSNSDAALVRLNDGNRDFAALLDHVEDEIGVQQIIPLLQDLSFVISINTFCSTSKITAVDQPNISTPFIAVIGPSKRQRSTGVTSPYPSVV